MLTKLQPKMLDNFKQSDTYLIGTGGDYASVNDALQDLSRKYMTYIQGGLEIELQMVAGHVLDEQILASAIDLSGFTLTGQDAETVIDRASISLDFEGQKPVFGAKNAARMMRIGQLFSMNRSGADQEKIGVFCTEAGTSINVLSGAGIKNVYGIGLNSVGATVYAVGSDFSSSTGVCFEIFNSRAILNNAIARDSGESACRAIWTSTVDCNQADFSNAQQYGLYSQSGSTSNFRNGTANNCLVSGASAQFGGSINLNSANVRIGTTDSNSDMRVLNGGLIYADSAVGGANIAFNTLTQQGIIFQ
jgi:hypothetical protein